jgi:hypothetical protein
MKKYMGFINSKPGRLPDFGHFSKLGKHKASEIGKDLKITDLEQAFNVFKKSGRKAAIDGATFYVASKMHTKVSEYLKA